MAVLGVWSARRPCTVRPTELPFTRDRPHPPRERREFPCTLDDLILVSVDDHLVEPPDLFERHLAREVRGPVRRRSSTTTTAPTSGPSTGRSIPNIGLNAVAGRPKEEYGIDPTAFDEMRPGCFDVHERVKDMNAGGVLGSMNFPCLPGFAGRLFAAADDKDLALAVLARPTTTGTSTSGAAAYPGRFIPMALPVLWDAELAAEEMRAARQEGLPLGHVHREPGAARLPELPRRLLGPVLDARCVDDGMVLSMHLGSSGQLAMTAPDAPIDVMITLQPMNICTAAADLIWSRVIKKFPDIKFALSEGGIGWIPYFLERLDRTYDMHHAWTGQDFGEQAAERGVPRALPHLLHRRPGRRAAAPRHRHRQHRLGVRLPALRLVVARRARGARRASPADVPDDEINKITHENAMRWYSFDPFAHPPEGAVHGRARCAPRSPGHDVSIRRR